MGRREPEEVGAAERLPEAYAKVLAHLEAGDPDRVIAEDIGVDVTAVPALVRLATAKLLALLEDDGQRAQRRTKPS